MTFQDRARAHRRLAAAALEGRRWPEAEGELRALLTIDPDDAIAWNNLGVALERQHRERAAVEAYARAAALRPTSTLPGTNLIRGMQRYLGFAAAIVIFKIVEVLLHVARIPDSVRTVVTIAALTLLILGAFVYYLRQREQLPEETWRAYRSEMEQTRRLRYGGIAFVFVGFLVFALILVALVTLGRGTDGEVALVIVAGLCWLIVARLVWRRVVAPLLQR